MKELALGCEATIFMVLLAAFYVFIYRYTHQTDIVVGSPISGRIRKEIEELIGFFVNILPLGEFQHFPFGTGIAAYDLILETEEREGKLCCFFDYNNDLFEPTTVERMAECFMWWIKILSGKVRHFAVISESIKFTLSILYLMD